MPEAAPSPPVDSTAEAEAPRSTTPATPRRRHHTAPSSPWRAGSLCCRRPSLCDWRHPTPPWRNRQAEQSPYLFEPGRTYSCDIHREGGLLHTGHSDSTEAVLQQITTSGDVVEAQCLLEYRGYEVGVIDGAYGAATERAVKRFQDDAGLVVDGIMGPHTWRELRR